MLAEFGTPEISILVVVALAVVGGIIDSRKTKQKFDKEFTEFKTTTDLKMLEIEKDIAELKVDLKEHIELDRKERQRLYDKFDRLPTVLLNLFKGLKK